MSNDTIEDVRARHKNTEKAFSDDTAYETARDIHVDRAFLLAEVDRLTRERDEARAEVGRMKKLHPPFANLPWPARGEAKP